MATAMFMDWAGVTKDQYDEARKIVNWEGDAPDGAVLHVATFDADGAHIVDVWESEDAFNRFSQQRLAAGVEKAGIQGQPNVTFRPVHALFTPGL